MSDAVKQVIVLFVFFGLPGIVGAWIASTKGRSMLFWLLLCGCFPPTLMILINQGPTREVEGHYRRCPSCNEMQPWKLSLCKYCGAGMVKETKEG